MTSRGSALMDRTAVKTTMISIGAVVPLVTTGCSPLGGPTGLERLR